MDKENQQYAAESTASSPSPILKLPRLDQRGGQLCSACPISKPTPRKDCHVGAVSGPGPSTVRAKGAVSNTQAATSELLLLQICTDGGRQGFTVLNSRVCPYKLSSVNRH